MQKRTRYGLALLSVLALGGALAWFKLRRPTEGGAAGALDAIPNGALLVAVADVGALRASPIGAPLFGKDREIPGLGKVRDVCGFDPMEGLTEVAVAIPAAGESGDFGLAAAGAVKADELLTCASKVINARGGRAVVTQIGSFQAVRDADLITPGGEIAVRPGGPVLLGGGAYLRAMIDSADSRAPSIRSSVAHTELAGAVGGGAARVTVVLTPEQRAEIADDLALRGAGSSPAASVLAGALGIKLGPRIELHAVIACATAPDCERLGVALRDTRDARADDYATRLVGFGSVLERIELQVDGQALHLRVSLAADEAGTLLERLVTLRGMSHPMPDPSRRREVPPDDVTPPPAEQIAPPRGSAAPPQGSASPPRGAPPQASAAPRDKGGSQ